MQEKEPKPGDNQVERPARVHSRKLQAAEAKPAQTSEPEAKAELHDAASSEIASNGSSEHVASDSTTSNPQSVQDVNPVSTETGEGPAATTVSPVEAPGELSQAESTAEAQIAASGVEAPVEVSFAPPVESPSQEAGDALSESPAPVEEKLPPACRHEYVRIYQRKLKGLERRLCMQRAFLPVGFKMTDFGHLGEGSFCFCSKCRARLFPKRTQADKLAARLALQAAKGAEALAAMQAAEAVEDEGEMDAAPEPKVTDIHVEELEQESVDVQDIEAEGVKLADDEQTNCLSDEDI